MYISTYLSICLSLILFDSGSVIYRYDHENGITTSVKQLLTNFTGKGQKLLHLERQ